MPQPAKKPKLSANRVPTVTILCEQLGFGPKINKSVTALTDTTQFWRKQYRTPTGVLGKDLTRWKDPSVQEDLQLMVQEYLDIQGFGARLWPAGPQFDGKRSALEYPADKDRSKKRKRDDVVVDPVLTTITPTLNDPLSPTRKDVISKRFRGGQTPTAAGGSVPSENAHVSHHDITSSPARSITPSRILSALQTRPEQCERTRLLDIDTGAYPVVHGPSLSVRETPIPRQRNPSVEPETSSVHSPKTASLPPHSKINGPSGTPKPSIDVRFWIIKARVPLLVRERWKSGKIQGETLESVWERASEFIQNNNIQELKFALKMADQTVIYSLTKDTKDSEDDFTEMKDEFDEVIKAAFRKNRNEMKHVIVEMEPTIQDDSTRDGEAELEDAEYMGYW